MEKKITVTMEDSPVIIKAKLRTSEQPDFTFDYIVLGQIYLVRIAFNNFFKVLMVEVLFPNFWFFLFSLEIKVKNSMSYSDKKLIRENLNDYVRRKFIPSSNNLQSKSSLSTNILVILVFNTHSLYIFV